MPFPQTKLPITVELQINGAWTDISGDVRTQGGTDAILIKRGVSASGGTVAEEGSCSMTLDNNAGAYSNRNPMSPYYGFLGRNTPLRVGVAYGTPWLDVPYGSTNRATTPDASVLDITGDLDVRVDAELATWGDAAGNDTTGTVELVGKYNTAGQRSWRLLFTETGSLRLNWSTDGSVVFFADSDVIDVPPGVRLSVRATLDVNNGSGGYTATFYTSTTPGTAGPWVQSGRAFSVSPTTNIFNSTAALEIGDLSSLGFGNLARKIYSVEVRNGIGGTIVANPNFESQTVGATSFADTAPSPRTWTVTVGAISNRFLRFVGEVSEWPPQWDTGGMDVTTPIVASGILQRYGQSKTVLQSTLRRRIAALATLNAYWPMEEGADATQASSPIAGVQPMQVTGFTWAADSSLAGSAPLPQLAPPSTMTARTPGSLPGDWHVECVYKLDTLPASPTLMLQANLSAGTAATIQFLIGVAAARITVLDSTGATIASADFAPNNFTDGWGRLQLWTSTSSGTVTVFGRWLVIGAPQAWFVTTAFAGSPGRVATVLGTWGSAFADLRLGHLAVFPETGVSPYDNADIAFDGETAAARLARVATEQGARMSVAAYAADTELVGAQAMDTFLSVVTSAAQADEGMLCEAREFLGLRYRGRASLYDQPSALDLPYVATPQALMVPLRPVDDLQGVRNDSTVTRLDGSSGRSVIATGPLSTQDPPAGIGTGYDEDVTLNLHTDGQAALHAGWRTHLGTWDEARFPEVNISLEKNPALIPAAVRIDTGSRIRITPPLLKQLPPDPIDQLVLGYEENISQFSWRLAFACQPYGPYRVAVADDAVLGRADTDGSQLGASITSTATSMQIATTSGPLWDTDPAQYPVDIRMGGETITVTGVTGSSSPQTATVTRSVNSVVKAQTAGTAITVATAAIAAL
ncbi:hypothetical protein [Actinacidiphila sp. ITFR-21]|uniref:hypothetical protein n=1 Tax=Actinacidiphila sp. ITFR-21 TaxID=3075199 RepID=UPI00288C0124|nr:hypothetical protein [Streptomyces sp. ITFR-21]WNI19178.1 hypothetical protein RLT57_28985 [Streptomyces sp. ITFR-21]